MVQTGTVQARDQVLVHVDGKYLQQHARLVISLLIVKHDSKIDVPRCHASVSFDCTPVHDTMKGEARRLSRHEQDGNRR